MRKLSLFLATLLFTFPATSAEYYVWVDENGVTNYSERSPQGYEAQFVGRSHRFGERVPVPGEEDYPGSRPGSQPPAEPVASASSGESAGSTDPDSLIDEQRADIAAQIAETKRANCEIGKRNLAQLEAFARVRVKDANGQERVLTEEEHQQQIQDARQLISENCVGG
ncbi:MAG: DUF4124 domain-containing protein [Pseudomonadota bacterium]